MRWTVRRRACGFWRCRRSGSGVWNELQELLLVEDGNAELLGFGELGSRVLACHHVARLPADGPADLAARVFDEPGRVLAAERGKSSGEHEDAAFERAARGTRRGIGELQAGLAQAFQQLAIVDLAEEADDAFRDLRS